MPESLLCGALRLQSVGKTPANYGGKSLAAARAIRPALSLDSSRDDEGQLLTPAFMTPDYHEHDDLLQALARLRPPQRELLCTYYGIGRPRLKPGKLLQQLGIAKSTLSLRRRLALRALRKMLARSA